MASLTAIPTNKQTIVFSLRNPQEEIDALSQIPSLFQLALAQSQGLSSQITIKDFMNQHQSLLLNSSEACKKSKQLFNQYVQLKEEAIRHVKEKNKEQASNSLNQMQSHKNEIEKYFSELITESAALRRAGIEVIVAANSGTTLRALKNEQKETEIPQDTAVKTVTSEANNPSQDKLIKTLGKIKTTLENSWLFWNEMQMQSAKLNTATAKIWLDLDGEEGEFVKATQEIESDCLNLDKITQAVSEAIDKITPKIEESL